jgi:ankyrin repeat protein
LKLNLKSNIKYVLYLIVLVVNISAHGGSYDDFFTAIKHDDAATINNLLQRGFDANTRDTKGQHGLYLAIQEPSLKAAAALIAWPQTQVESRNAADESPLMLASLKGLTEVVRQLVEKGADVNKPGWAPLHYAATNGHLEIMNLLLENHAYIDASSPNGSTPLMMAALYGSPSAVKLLLEAGADPLITNSLGLNAVAFAQRHGRMESAEIIAAFVRGRQPKGKW